MNKPRKKYCSTSEYYTCYFINVKLGINIKKEMLILISTSLYNGPPTSNLLMPEHPDTQNKDQIKRVKHPK
jgi:hypothetical protein